MSSLTVKLLIGQGLVCMYHHIPPQGLVQCLICNKHLVSIYCLADAVARHEAISENPESVLGRQQVLNKYFLNLHDYYLKSACLLQFK